MSIAAIQLVLFTLFYLAIFVLCVWSLVDLLRRPASAFPAAGKRTKNFWGLILGVAVVIAFIALPPLGALRFLSLLSAVAAIVYLVDVKPAVTPYSKRRGGGSRGPWDSGRGW
ncbi:DUF2516 family protein [Cellulomonas sp.]|uniref:DUF2516 family protein n=1 Tax=Cellulomonas sp. TaxID=40001 RepID=UPI001B1BC3FE|nr:DUF2516 family protein [Cellulomonas sp.]MBO9555271.1 DUF2516 family protein [Cellulomonas sp.]